MLTQRNNKIKVKFNAVTDMLFPLMSVILF